MSQSNQPGPAEDDAKRESSADEQYGDISADHASLARLTLGIGPDEAAVGDPEVEAIAVDLDDAVETRGDLADVVGIGYERAARSTLPRR